jgi:aminoglycoside phosphotransferase family enzyme
MREQSTDRAAQLPTTIINGNTVKIAQKVAVLSDRAIYSHSPRHVDVIETHMAWVFLAGEFAFKMKKPVHYEFLDFTTLSAREFTCREELRLNRRLAPDVYLDVVPLRLDQTGALTLAGDGPVVEWLVKMKRLPADRMLDCAIEHRTVTVADVVGFAEKLTTFYRAAPPVSQSIEQVCQRFSAEHERNVVLLSDAQFELEHVMTRTVLERMTKALSAARPLLKMRVEVGAFLEGHGDLRPEHVCLISPPVVIDCLEFNRDMRLVDPFDEIAFLDLECERLGAPWIGQRVLDICRRELSPAPPAGLLTFYRSARALLRARLALAHLTESNPRMPEKWEPRARIYIALAEEALTRFESAAGR